ncbi:MAG: TonB family protein [Pedobacter sp.]|nr:MAG: TonB family protein [Pedobacter sp.]
MKTLLFSLCFLMSISFLQAQQKKQNVYFLKDNNKEVAIRDSADFIRIIHEPDSGETNFMVQEFYKNGKKKTIGKVSNFEPFLVYEGSVMTFFDDGSRKDIIQYEKGKRIGIGYFYFRNGKLKRQYEYSSIDKNVSVATDANTMQLLNSEQGKLVYLADSLGTVLVKDGIGHAVEVSGVSDNQLTEEGDYLNGLKSGTWVGRYHSGKSSYEEIYDAGKFVSGKSVQDGIDYPYTVVMTAPIYKAGVNEFYRYLGRSIKYPSDAVKSNISGSVALSFVVNKDGKISDVEVLKGVSPSIDEEAKRVLTYSPKWQPATHRGLPVRVKYNLPIKFSLGR